MCIIVLIINHYNQLGENLEFSSLPLISHIIMRPKLT